MIRKVLLSVGALLLAGMLGWELANTKPATGRFSGSEAVSLPDPEANTGTNSVAQSLETLYERSAWSAVKPQRNESEEAAPEEVSQPEGLDRFGLLGILRVSGREPEALLKDLNEGDGQPAVFRATEGDNLQDSGVVLAEISQQKISLEQAGESRELFLFPRSPTNGRDE